MERCRSTRETYVDVERHGEVATLTLNDPERYNSLTPELCFQLRERLAELCSDTDIRVIILTGKDEAFCAGGDLGLIQDCKGFIDEGYEGAATIWRWIRNQFGGIARLISQSDTYVIAAVNGPAAGVGLSFAFACDHIIMADEARLVMAFGEIALAPEVGTNWFLTRAVGYQKAMELFVSGEAITADSAKDMGLVNSAVKADALLPAANKWAEKVCRLPDSVIAMTKTQMRKVSDMTWEQAIVMEEFAEPICFTTRSHRSSVDALVRSKRD
ncbi:enoyl-CoA hydratase [Tamilnaduibacter salinus]|uniref:Enoyl-CoA hydratase n=1 Tax=Tamilnaduibacter salinus TaxID=1484056 RepID=A0A2A2I3K5_9GAMM|nr:enoyl-CoA hydratase [Tamilnaduibacter salinus]